MDIGGRCVITQCLIIELLKLLIIVITVLFLQLFYPYFFSNVLETKLKLPKNLNIFSRLLVQNYPFSRTFFIYDDNIPITIHTL